MIGRLSDAEREASRRPPKLLLSGRPGCGKTTVIKRSLARIGAHRCVGFYTQEVREGGRRIGFDVVTLEGARGPLARIGLSGPRVGRYGVDIASFERLSLRPLESARSSPKILVLDEIGKMELFSAKFVALLRRLFDDPSQPILGTVLAGRHPLVEPLRRRPEVEIVEVTGESRERLPEAIGRLFAEYVANPDGIADL
jgi:nucleoside-triphosphatase